MHVGGFFLSEEEEDRRGERLFHTTIAKWRWCALQMAMMRAPNGDGTRSKWRWRRKKAFNNHKKAVQTSLGKLAPLVQKAHYVQCAL